MAAAAAAVGDTATIATAPTPDRTINMFYTLGAPADKWPVMRNLVSFFASKAGGVIYATIGKVDFAIDGPIAEKTSGKWIIVGPEEEGAKAIAAVSDSSCPYMVKPDDVVLLPPANIRSLEKIDFCRIDTGAATRMTLYELMDAGYRPSLITVRFTESPDADVTTQIAAAHLQCCGYSLVGVHENKYLYYYTDNPIYDYCSWTQIALENPLITEFKAAFAPKKKQD